MTTATHPYDVAETDDVPKVDTTSKNMHSDSTPVPKDRPATVRRENGVADGQTPAIILSPQSGRLVTEEPE